jgi:uncharacterized membrane protein YbhN (UPF0104 family)
MHYLFTFLRIAVAVGLLLYLSVSGAIDWPSIFGLALAWSTTVKAFLLLFVTLLLQAQRFRLLLKPQGMSLSFYSSVKLFFMGIFFNSCLPGALEVTPLKFTMQWKVTGAGVRKLRSLSCLIGRSACSSCSSYRCSSCPCSPNSTVPSDL